MIRNLTLNNSSLKKMGTESSENEKGVILVFVAIMLPVLVGVGALVIDAGSWYHDKREMQTIADIAAIGGAMAIKQGHTDLTTITAYATHDASLNSFTSSSDKSLTINNPPTSGAYAGNSKAVEAIIKMPSTAYLSFLYSKNSPQIGARSVSVVNSPSSCIASLGTTSGITLNGGGSINMSSCGVYSNGTITGNGGGSITADTVSAVGTISGTYVNGINGTFRNSPIVSDPYINMTMPTPGKCDQNNFSIAGSGGNGKGNKVTKVNAGTYCNGFKLTSSANVAMNPGVYIIDRGSFDIGAQSNLSGTGVTIYLTSSTGSNYASVNIGGSATVDLSAPTSGTYKGMLIMQDRKTPTNTSSSAGGSAQVLNGILYFPATVLAFAGNSTVSGSSCLQVYSKGLTISGASTFGSGCATSPATSVGVVQLLE